MSERRPESAREAAQRERARGSWGLRVGSGPPLPRAARRILRVKRSELAALEQRLPGVVRRGARVDLEPLVEALAAAGVCAELVRLD